MHKPSLAPTRLVKKSAQASLEYLTTYCWAFILIIVMIGALAYFGVLNPKKLLPDRCSFGPEIACSNYVLSTNGMQLRLKSNIDEPIILSAVNVVVESNTISCTSTSIAQPWNPQEIKNIAAICDFSSIGLVSGSKEKINLELRYYKIKDGSSYTKIVQGEVLTTIQGTTGEGGAGGSGDLPIAALTGNSCKELKNNGFITDGTYTINVDGQKLSVYCDMTTEDGGWTLGAVCRADEPKCWNVNSVGALSQPTQTTSAKLSDSVIRSILISGDKVTRTYWRQATLFGAPQNPPASATVYNLIASPDQWSSDVIGGDGKEYSLKYKYTDKWTKIFSKGTGCSGAANGWSNTQQDSCGITWFAGCEKGPTMSHLCANFEERANIAVWLR